MGVLALSWLCAPHPAHARPGVGREACDWVGSGNSWEQLGPRKAVTWRKGTLAKVTGAGCSGGDGSAESSGWRHSLKIER